jgi:hypothetical protein
VTATADAGVKCPGCGAECPLPDRPAAAMRIHCRGCDRRFDAVRAALDEGPFRGQWGFTARETRPSPSRKLIDISGHPWLRRIRIVRTWRFDQELGLLGRDLVWSIGVGRLRWRRTFTARYVQEMRVDYFDGGFEFPSHWSLSAVTSLGEHWRDIGKTRADDQAELGWLAEHIMSGIELDKLMDEELEPGTSSAPGRPRRRSGRKR